MRKLLIAAMIGSFFTSAALAQTPPSTTTTPPPATKSKKATGQPRTAESIECSKQADAQGLKGKPRKAFRAKCKKDLLSKKAA